MKNNFYEFTTEHDTYYGPVTDTFYVWAPNAEIALNAANYYNTYDEYTEDDIFEIINGTKAYSAILKNRKAIKYRAECGELVGWGE